MGPVFLNRSPYELRSPPNMKIRSRHAWKPSPGRLAVPGKAFSQEARKRTKKTSKFQPQISKILGVEVTEEQFRRKEIPCSGTRGGIIILAMRREGKDYQKLTALLIGVLAAILFLPLRLQRGVCSEGSNHRIRFR